MPHNKGNRSTGPKRATPTGNTPRTGEHGADRRPRKTKKPEPLPREGLSVDEACGALYPSMERIRAEYDDRITLVVRYFPLPGHQNGELAARAVEAAAAQDAFEETHRMMFETQASWGEQQTSREAVFAGFADKPGLDPKRFKESLDDPATAQRVAGDVDDGVCLGVEGTPTLFLNGKPLEQRSYETLKQAIDEALAG